MCFWCAHDSAGWPIHIMQSGYIARGRLVALSVTRGYRSDQKMAPRYTRQIMTLWIGRSPLPHSRSAFPRVFFFLFQTPTLVNNTEEAARRLIERFQMVVSPVPRFCNVISMDVAAMYGACIYFKDWLYFFKWSRWMQSDTVESELFLEACGQPCDACGIFFWRGTS